MSLTISPLGAQSYSPQITPTAAQKPVSEVRFGNSTYATEVIHDIAVTNYTAYPLTRIKTQLVTINNSHPTLLTSMSDEQGWRIFIMPGYKKEGSVDLERRIITLNLGDSLDNPDVFLTIAKAINAAPLGGSGTTRA